MLRFAVIGTNFITERFLAAAALCEDFVLTTVYSRSLQTAQQFAQKWGAPYTTDSLAALANSAEVDAVYVASPNRYHAQHSILLLRAGKHVLCEKPMASSAAELEAMLQAARESGTVLLEAMRPAHLPAMETLRSAMRKIGPVRSAEISYCQYSSRYDKFKQGVVENAFDPTLCNGALMDIGVYCVHVLLMLFGVPQEICARGWFLPRSIDAGGCAICRYDEMLAQLSYSKVHQSNSPSQLQGERGTVFFAPTATPTRIWAEYRDGTREDFAVTQCEHDMLYELQCMIRLVQTGESAEPWHTQSRSAARLMDEMRRQIGIDFTIHA